MRTPNGRWKRGGITQSRCSFASTLSKKWTILSGIERGGITQSFHSFVPLRVLASPKSLTAQVHFVHAQSIEPSTRVRTSTHEKIKDPQGVLYFFRRERGSNPRSCDRLRFSRPAQSTTLASLRGLGQYSKNPRYFQPKEKSPQLWLQGFPLKKFRPYLMTIHFVAESPAPLARTRYDPRAIPERLN